MSKLFRDREWIITEPYTSIQNNNYFVIADRATGVSSVTTLKPGDELIDSQSFSEIIIGSMAKMLESIAKADKSMKVAPLDPANTVLHAEKSITRFKETTQVGDIRFHILEWVKSEDVSHRRRK
jgi:hypothetical protein